MIDVVIELGPSAAIKMATSLLVSSQADFETDFYVGTRAEDGSELRVGRAGDSVVVTLGSDGEIVGSALQAQVFALFLLKEGLLAEGEEKVYWRPGKDVSL